MSSVCTVHIYPSGWMEERTPKICDHTADTLSSSPSHQPPTHLCLLLFLLKKVTMGDPKLRRGLYFSSSVGRRIIGVGLLLLLGITTAAAAPPSSSPPPTKKQSTTPPNILILLTDDQDVVLGSFDHMPHAKTMLQDQGKTFVRGLFVHTPIQGGQQR